MVAVHVGTDTYGKVKRVGTTAIVTKFVMISAFPLWPSASFYYAGPGETQYEGIPFVFTSQTTSFRGLPLARLDTLSVVMAYIRGLFAVLTVFGSCSVFALVNCATGQRRDEFAVIFTNYLLSCLCVGVGGGLLTYISRYQTTSREKAIRQECGEVLGIFADPARIRQEHARTIADALAKQTRSDAVQRHRPARNPTENRREWQHKLVGIRAGIALGQPREPLERKTDELLEQIEQTSRIDGH